MKTKISSVRQSFHSRAASGSAIIVVLVFLSLMAALVVSNNLALHHLDKSLRLIEQKQLKKFIGAAHGGRPASTAR